MNQKLYIWLCAVAVGAAIIGLLRQTSSPSSDGVQNSSLTVATSELRNPTQTTQTGVNQIPANLPATQSHGERLANLLRLPTKEAINYLADLDQSDPANSRLITGWFTEMAESSGAGDRGMGRSDFDAIVEASHLIPDGPGLQGGIKKASTRFIELDRIRCLTWAQSLASEQLRRHAYQGVYTHISRLGAEDRVSIINGILTCHLELDSTLEAYLNVIGIAAVLETNPDKAREWLLATDDASSAAADEKFVASAQPSDVSAFVQALYQREATNRADAALLMYLNRMAVHAPLETANWLQQIEGDVPAAAITTLVMVWAASDRPAAERWVQQAAPDERKAELLKVAASVSVKK